MIRVAVIGFGFMGMTHVRNILNNKQMKLVGIVDSQPEMIEKKLEERGGNLSTGEIKASELSGINVYSNLEDCFKSEDPDAVFICVHSNLHYEMSLKALQHNKHVFVEKPFCLNIKQAEELILIAEQLNKILMVGHVVRFMSPYQKLKQWVDNNEFGKLKFLSLSRFCGIPGWGSWKKKEDAITFGGALFDLVIHDIDFANYVVGLPSDIKCNYLPGSFSKHDYISAMWSYSDSNVHVKIEGGFTFHEKFPFQAGYMAQFEKASILFSSADGNVIQIADDVSIKEVPAGDAGEAYNNEIVYFAQCIENNTQPEECMPVSSLQAIQLCYDHL
jgi:predicted dehydrogenase